MLIERLHSVGLFIAGLAMLGLAMLAAGCTRDVPQWRVVTLLDDSLPVRARDEATGATIQLFPQEGDQIMVRLAPAPLRAPVRRDRVILSRAEQ
jgi:hypothetical protein